MTTPDTFYGETRHGTVKVKIYPTDAEVEIWRGGNCHTSFKCSMSELVSVAGVGATAYHNRLPYMTQEDQIELGEQRKSFKLGTIMHASRPKDERLIERMKKSSSAMAST